MRYVSVDLESVTPCVAVAVVASVVLANPRFIKRFGRSLIVHGLPGRGYNPTCRGATVDNDELSTHRRSLELRPAVFSMIVEQFEADSKLT